MTQPSLQNIKRRLEELLAIPNGKHLSRYQGVCAEFADNKLEFNWVFSAFESYRKSQNMSCQVFIDEPGRMTEKRRRFIEHAISRVADELSKEAAS